MTLNITLTSMFKESQLLLFDLVHLLKNKFKIINK